MINDIPHIWVVLFIHPDNNLDLWYCDIISPDPYDTIQWEQACNTADQWGYTASLVAYQEFHDLFLITDDRITYSNAHDGIWCKLRDMGKGLNNAKLLRQIRLKELDELREGAD